MDKTSDLLLTLFIEELLKWNEKINLISKREIPVIVEKHLEDSIRASEKIGEKLTVVDLGSGNGFPLIPLAVLKKKTIFHGFESIYKKALFLETVVNKLKLDNVTIHNKRIEEAALGFLETADIAISRAFKCNEQFVEKALPMLKKKSMIISYNALSENEINKMEQNLSVLIENVDNFVYKLKSGVQRNIISFSMLKKSILD